MKKIFYSLILSSGVFLFALPALAVNVGTYSRSPSGATPQNPITVTDTFGSPPNPANCQGGLVNQIKIWPQYDGGIYLEGPFVYSWNGIDTISHSFIFSTTHTLDYVQFYAALNGTLKSSCLDDVFADPTPFVAQPAAPPAPRTWLQTYGTTTVVYIDHQFALAVLALLPYIFGILLIAGLIFYFMDLLVSFFRKK